MLKIVPRPSTIKILSDQIFSYDGSDIATINEDGYAREGYRLTINENGISSYASSANGHFYAQVTLKQLLLSGDLPHVDIIDAPLYPHRGYMLDCARHFFSIDTIKKQIDAMAQLKLNVFHWHLTEDQGWRIQIDKYPRLTEIGSIRSQTRGDGTPISGYYTKDEIRDVVSYAKERYIDVIPEIDMPGHMSAAVASYPFISCEGKQIAVKESFGIHAEVVCAGKEESYKFLFDVLDEVVELFPYEYIHLGGDEALRLKWMDCPLCQATIREKGLKDEHELQAYFMSKMVKYLKTKNKAVINWNDGLIGENNAKDIVVHYWHEKKESVDAAIREINSGKKVILSPFFSYYLDYPYGMTSLKKTYNFMPELTRIKDKSNVLGVESPLWTEHVTNEKQLEYQTYPRLVAVAEIGWSAIEHRNYRDFLVRMENILKIFDKMGIKYATIKDANPNIIKGKIKVVKFFLHAADKQSLKLVMENQRRLKVRSEYNN